MSPDSLVKLIQARPFVPFTLRTADGRSFDVPHPELISVSRAGRTARVSTEEFNGEGVEFLDVFLLVGASTCDPDLSSSGAGGGDHGTR